MDSSVIAISAVNIIPEDTISTPRRKPALAGTQPFPYFATLEESGIPVDEWE